VGAPVARRLAVAAALAAAGALPLAAQADGPALRRILFGSCLIPTRPHPTLDAAVRERPDLFIFMGDNVYADTTDPAVLERKYAELANDPEFQRLEAACPVLATWDDHDYGANDAGADFPAKVMSRERFLDFWKVPPDSPRRAHEGVYDSASFGPPDRRVQVILLDTRSFRSRLRIGRIPGLSHGPFVPNEDPDATILGAGQWRWLEARLREPARVRLIVSSIQVLAAQHGWEAWANFPREQQRLLETLRATSASGVIFLSGDRHFAEISRFDAPGLYPLYDVTSSGLNRRFPVDEANPNRFRVGGAFIGHNFGELDIDWDREDPLLAVRILDAEGRERLRQEIPLDSLRARP
jgi:alkaline phosphatase D